MNMAAGDLQCGVHTMHPGTQHLKWQGSLIKGRWWRVLVVFFFPGVKSGSFHGTFQGIELKKIDRK